MNYQYSPIYKYILLVILITCFLNYYTNISKSDFLLLGVLFTSLFLLSDYIIIENHPYLLDEHSENKYNLKNKTIKIKNDIVNEIDLMETFTDDLENIELNQEEINEDLDTDELDEDLTDTE